MQTSVPGADGPVARSQSRCSSCTAPSPGKPSFANNCLLARRLVERGVRFVQLFHARLGHRTAPTSARTLEKLPHLCRRPTRPSAALLKDLKQRGLLDDTLVVWGGEFGRTPMAQGATANSAATTTRGFTMWLAGGGIKRGVTYGATDELGFNAVEDPVHVHDLHATILHLLGFDHAQLTYRFQGRDFRLTDVHGKRGQGAAGVRATAVGIRPSAIGTLYTRRPFRRPRADRRRP